MWKELSAVGALTIGLAATPALAQQSPGQMNQPPTGSQQAPANQGIAPPSAQDMQTSGLVGKEVWSADGQRLGEVTRVNQHSGGRIESIRVSVETFLGIGGQTLEVDADQFRQRDGRIELTSDAEQLLLGAESESE